MYTVDIHSNKETTKDAISMLEASIPFGRKDKDRILCLITGYGSTSGHGRIKETIIEILNSWVGSKIKDYLIGSELDIFNKRYQNCKYKDKLPKEESRYPNPGKIYIFL